MPKSTAGDLGGGGRAAGAYVTEACDLSGATSIVLGSAGMLGYGRAVDGVKRKAIWPAGHLASAGGTFP